MPDEKVFGRDGPKDASESIASPPLDDDHEREKYETPVRGLSVDPLHAPGQDGEAGTELRQVATGSSRAASVREVPRSKRSGLLASLSLLYEAEEPKNYPRKIKWLITFWVAFAAMAAPMGSSIIYRVYSTSMDGLSSVAVSLTDNAAALGSIIDEFHTTPFLANFSVALYQLSLAIFPLWWSSFSETSGRRTVYVIAFSLLVLWNVLAAVSTSISMFIIMRILSGGCSAAVQSVGAGTIADIWEVKERGRAMGIFYLGPLCGPLLSPVIGGALTEGLGWRSTQWFQTIYGGVVLVAVLLSLPETHKHSVILSQAEEDVARPLSRTASRQSAVPTATLKLKKYTDVAYRVLIDPLKMVAYLRFPAVALTVYYAAIAFASLYFLNISVETTFAAPPYNFSSVVVGCLYLFNSVGYLLASISGGPWVDRIMAREARRAGRVDARGRLQYRPEDRFRENVWLAGLLMPAALLWYGWTARYEVFFVAPMVANFFYGVGSMLLFGAATTMLTEFMPRQSSAGVAVNNLVRNIFAFVATFTAEPALRSIGNGWLFTIVGLVCLASIAVVPTMRRYGDRWRVQMDKQLG